jgi:arginyl-tRNA synthetase
MNAWTLSGMRQTYKNFGSEFDVWTYESQIYDRAKKAILDSLKKGIFEKDSRGNTIARLEPELPDKVVLRADGTSVYMTQDLYLAKMRFKDYRLDRLVYVVASEQNLHFKQLFAIPILRKMGWEFSDRCSHLSYGLVNLPGGRMKTREGNVVDADDLIEELSRLAKEEILKREKLGKKELKERSNAIALAAIKYYLLKIEPVKDLLFDPEKAISFEGDTGPYLQYTYARAKSILRKSRKRPAAMISLQQDETDLVKKLALFDITVRKSAAELKPHYVANYLFELATLFNEFYHRKQVLRDKREAELLRLVLAVAATLKTGLGLLGIKPLERM